MPAARVAFHPGASEDYAAAFAWYYARGTALASDLRGKSIAESGLYLETRSVGLSLTAKDDAS